MCINLVKKMSLKSHLNLIKYMEGCKEPPDGCWLSSVGGCFSIDGADSIIQIRSWVECYLHLKKDVDNYTHKR